MNKHIHIFRHYRWLYLFSIVWVMWICPFYTFAAPVEEQQLSEQSEYTKRANDIMQKVFNYVEDNHLENERYMSDVYVRHRMHTKKHGPIARYMPGMLRLERGEHDYLTEVRLRFQYRPPGESDCKVVAYHSTARYQKPNRFVSMNRFNFQIYDSNLFLDCILNPMHKRNKRFYRYKYLFTSKINEKSPPTIRISIDPRFKNDQLVEGYIDINSETGAVRNFSFNLRYQLRDITISGRTGPQGFATLMPERLRILSDFSLMKNRINEVYEIYSKHVFCENQEEHGSRHSKYDITRQCMLRIDTTKVINDIVYFDSIRPIPLRNIEKELLKNMYPDIELEDRDFDYKSPNPFSVHKSESDSLTCNENNTEQERQRRIFNGRTKEIFLSSHDFNLGNEGRAHLQLPALLTPSRVGWSRTKGFSLKIRPRWDFYLSSKDFEPSIEFDPSLGYSFKQKQIYWDTPLYIRFSPSYNGLITLDAGGGSHMYNSKQADELRHKLQGVEKYDSIMHIIDQYGFHDYRDTHASLDVAFSPIPGIRLTLGGRYHRHSLIDWNNLADKTGLTHHFSSIGPRIQVEWTPCQYYYWKGPRRIPLYSKYPTLLFNYERGYSLGEGETRYERFELDARYRLPLYAMRTLYFRGGGGFYSRRGNDCFLNYDYFKFNYMPDNWNDELTGEFQLLDARWYNESRYYLRFTGTYESPMMLFSRIPGLTRIIQKERVYLNLLSVHSLGFYTELGYGFSSHLLDVGAFMSIAPDHSLDFGCKFVLKFFDD